MKKVAILQSNYIPWKGYFDMIAAVDEFIIFDDVQFTRRDWRNRNQIKTPRGLEWLTVPVQVKGKYKQKINETIVDGSDWQSLHWKSIIQNYSHAPYFKEIAILLEPLYLEYRYIYLSSLNRCFLEVICNYLKINTVILNSSTFHSSYSKTERLAELCILVGGTEYISGPSAKNYIDKKIFDDMNITLTWFDYNGYKEYSQLWGKFNHEVSILDLLFNCGKNSSKYMRYVDQ
jgi:hypothetical protein